MLLIRYINELPEVRQIPSYNLKITSRPIDLYFIIYIIKKKNYGYYFKNQEHIDIIFIMLKTHTLFIQHFHGIYIMT